MQPATTTSDFQATGWIERILKCTFVKTEFLLEFNNDLKIDNIDKTIPRLDHSR